MLLLQKRMFLCNIFKSYTSGQVFSSSSKLMSASTSRENSQRKLLLLERSLRSWPASTLLHSAVPCLRATIFLVLPAAFFSIIFFQPSPVWPMVLTNKLFAHLPIGVLRSRKERSQQIKNALLFGSSLIAGLKSKRRQSPHL